jgi:hypothetical protein
VHETWLWMKYEKRSREKRSEQGEKEDAKNRRLTVVPAHRRLDPIAAATETGRWERSRERMGEKREKDVENLKKENKYLPLPSVSRHAPQILHAPRFHLLWCRFLVKLGLGPCFMLVTLPGLPLHPLSCSILLRLNLFLCTLFSCYLLCLNNIKNTKL